MVFVPSKINPIEPNFAPSYDVFISLGSNQSYRDLSSCTLIQRALETLQEGGDTIIATSSLWKSDAWPKGTKAPDFINAVSRIKPFDADPALLLERLHQIEAKFGRQRDRKNQWSPRTLDLDLLDYNGLVWENNSFLTLPHPRIAVRDFVLRPLIQISPNWVHPIIQKNAEELLAELTANQLTNNCIQLD